MLAALVGFLRIVVRQNQIAARLILWPTAGQDGSC